MIPEGAWSALSALTNLVSLRVESFAPLGSFDFSILASLHRLQRLELQLIDSSTCTPEQVESLAQCRALTDLRCGPWVSTLMNARQKDVARRELILSRFALLLRRRMENGAAPLRRL